MIPNVHFVPIAIQRFGSHLTIIPRGDTMFAKDDHVVFITSKGGDEELCKLAGLYKTVTHHVARHTFATVALMNDMPIQYVIGETNFMDLVFKLNNNSIEDTIQNGVRHTEVSMNNEFTTVEDTIQNGVKHTRRNGDSMNTDAEDAIINGVKESKPSNAASWTEVEDTIENGVKHCEDGDWLNGDQRIDKIVENGLKV